MFGAYKITDKPQAHSGRLHLALCLSHGPWGCAPRTVLGPWLPLALLTSALMPDLGLWNLTPKQSLPWKLLGCFGQKVFQDKEVTVPEVIMWDVISVGLPHDRHEIYSFCQHILFQHLLRAGSVLHAEQVVSTVLELSFWWYPEDRASLLIKKKKREEKKKGEKKR